MIQIIGLMLCAYLVFKGYEILNVTLCSAREDRGWQIFFGALFFLASIVLALFFGSLLISQGNQMPQLPR
jgi:hypothetical protein